MEYITVKAALNDHFGKKVDTLQAHAELGRATQNPGESIESFAGRVRKLGRLAYPGMTDDDKAVEGSITSRFICGLRDEWAQGKLCGRAPSTLSDAVQIVKELRSRQEAIQAVRAAQQSTVTSVAVATGPSSDREAATAAGSGGDTRDLDQRISNMEHTMRALVASQRNLDSNSNGRAIKCYGCGVEGHIRRNCPNQQRSSGNRDARSARRDRAEADGTAGRPLTANGPPAPFCLCCGQHGHWMAGCRLLVGGGGGYQASASNNDSFRSAQARGTQPEN